MVEIKKKISDLTKKFNLKNFAELFKIDNLILLKLL
jgi:hypothetical protein